MKSLASTTTGLLHVPPNDQSELDVFQTAPGKLISTFIYYLGCPVMMLVAISTNLINVTVFLRGGLRDGMAINFLGLTISDLLYNMFYFMGRLLNAVQSVFDESPYLNTRHLSFIFAKYGRMWFNVSILLTVFAAIQKCACIAIPLTFRNFFTPRKSAITVLTIYVGVVAYFLPYLTLDQLRPYTERGTNRTRLGYWLRNEELAVRIDKFVTYANRIVLPYVSQGIVIVCVFTMTLKLRSAAKTRQKMTSARGDLDLNKATSEAHIETHNPDIVDKNKGSALSSKELRVVRSVNILCFVFVAGTTPHSIIEAFSLAIDTFDDMGRNRSLYFFLQGLQQIIEISSTAVNIAIYYHFNSKYRRTFKALFYPGTNTRTASDKTETG
ncbi:chemosensory receptor C [Elysia marginata]|uniref:Chemosensory receptor C n=1 Tax=Elysia marginata TaxID=1093978 RepID=A0AAV4GUF7_9GAST|nr:chemosensory receptor C [Elysia marginata]